MELKLIKEFSVAVESLAVVAEADGHENVRVLVNEFNSGENRFSLPGEVLIGGYVNGALVGICGLNVDPYEADENIGRVRRLFVHPEWRRTGLGSMLVSQIETVAERRFSILQLFTNSASAGAFYERLGYLRQARYKVSHAKQLSV